MNNKKSTEFENLNSILLKLSKNLGIERGLKEITLVNLWPEIVGPKFSKNSKIISIFKKNNQDIVLIAVSSSVVTQELLFFKQDILNKLYKIGATLCFDIKDIIFNTKLWDIPERNKDSFRENIEKKDFYFTKKPTKEELQQIEVSDIIINKIKKSISTQKFSSDELKDRILHTIIRDIKTKMWRKSKGFPLCSKCGIVLKNNCLNTEEICPSCKFLSR